MPVSQLAGCHTGPTFQAGDRLTGRERGSKSPGRLAIRPPSPEAANGLGPGTPWLAKLGSLVLAVKPTLWTTLCTSWGAHGASLWIRVHAGVNCPRKLGRGVR